MVMLTAIAYARKLLEHSLTGIHNRVHCFSMSYNINNLQVIQNKTFNKLIQKLTFM